MKKSNLQNCFYNEEIVKKRTQLYRDGFLLIRKKELRDVDDFLDKINKLNANPDLFEFQEKQKGTATLKLPVLHSQRFFVDFLFDSGLLKKTILYTGYYPYLTNFKHLLSKGKSSSLGWHRDTYLRNNEPVGLIPAPYKIIVYSSPADTQNACTEILVGSHRLDLHNRWIDRTLAILMMWHRQNVIVNAGDVLLFRVNIAHNRKAARYKSNRSATIYGMSLSPFHQPLYKEGDNINVIQHYNSRMLELRSVE